MQGYLQCHAVSDRLLCGRRCLSETTTSPSLLELSRLLLGSISASARIRGGPISVRHRHANRQGLCTCLSVLSLDTCQFSHSTLTARPSCSWCTGVSWCAPGLVQWTRPVPSHLGRRATSSCAHDRSSGCRHMRDA